MRKYAHEKTRLMESVQITKLLGEAPCGECQLSVRISPDIKRKLYSSLLSSAL
jgi:hypothetical protein